MRRVRSQSRASRVKGKQNEKRDDSGIAYRETNGGGDAGGEGPRDGRDIRSEGSQKAGCGGHRRGTANGTLLYADGSGIEMVEEENSDNVRLYECFWVRRDACENGEVQ